MLISLLLLISQVGRYSNQVIGFIINSRRISQPLFYRYNYEAIDSRSELTPLKASATEFSDTPANQSSRSSSTKQTKGTAYISAAFGTTNQALNSEPSKTAESTNTARKGNKSTKSAKNVGMTAGTPNNNNNNTLTPSPRSKTESSQSSATITRSQRSKAIPSMNAAQGETEGPVEFFTDLNKLSNRMSLDDWADDSSRKGRSGDEKARAMIEQNIKDLMAIEESLYKPRSANFSSSEKTEISKALAKNAAIRGRGHGSFTLEEASTSEDGMSDVLRGVIEEVEEMSRRADRENVALDFGGMATLGPLRTIEDDQKDAYDRLLKALDEGIPQHDGPLCPKCQRPAFAEELESLGRCLICRQEELTEPNIDLALRYSRLDYDGKYREMQAKIDAAQLGSADNKNMVQKRRKGSPPPVVPPSAPPPLLGGRQRFDHTINPEILAEEGVTSEYFETVVSSVSAQESRIDEMAKAIEALEASVKDLSRLVSELTKEIKKK